jgi:hypothetical protein
MIDKKIGNGISTKLPGKPLDTACIKSLCLKFFYSILGILREKIFCHSSPAEAADHR